MLDYRLSGCVVDEADVEVGIQGGGDFFEFASFEVISLKFVRQILRTLTCQFCEFSNRFVSTLNQAQAYIFSNIHD